MFDKEKFFRIWFRVMMATLVIAGFLVVDRLLFFNSAERVEGTAVRVEAKNGFCRHYNGKITSRRCTKFFAHVEYEVKSQLYKLKVKAGESGSPNASTFQARYQPGSRVPILYNSDKPSKSYFDDVFDIWKPVLHWLLLFLILSGIYSHFNGRQKKK